MTKDKFIDLDKVDPPKRIVKIEGEKIDISKMPAIVTIKLTRYQEEGKKIKEEDLEASEADRFLELVDIIVLGCKDNPKITKDWLIENANTDKIMGLVNAVIGKRDKKGTDDSKNVIEGKEK